MKSTGQLQVGPVKQKIYMDRRKNHWAMSSGPVLISRNDYFVFIYIFGKISPYGTLVQSINMLVTNDLLTWDAQCCHPIDSTIALQSFTFLSATVKKLRLTHIIVSMLLIQAYHTQIYFIFTFWVKGLEVYSIGIT